MSEVLVTHVMLEPLLWHSLPGQTAKVKTDNAVEGQSRRSLTESYLPLGMTQTSRCAAPVSLQCKLICIPVHMPRLNAAGAQVCMWQDAG